MRKLPFIMAAILLAFFSLNALAAPAMLPFIYVGSMTLEINGQKQWTEPYVGEGQGKDAQYRTLLKETLKITVPRMYIMNGVIADMDHPCATTGSAVYEKYKNGQKVEYWNCPDQSVPPLTQLASYAVIVAPPYVGSYYVGCTEVPLKGEYGEFNGSVWNKKKGQYYTHEIKIPEVPLPDTEHLAGKRTIDLGDGVKAELIWDFKPAADQ